MISETLGEREEEGMVERKSLKRVVWEWRVGEAGLMLLAERRQRRARRGFSVGLGISVVLYVYMGGRCEKGEGEGMEGRRTSADEDLETGLLCFEVLRTVF